MATTTTSIPTVERVEVHAARPEAADLRKIQHHAQARGASVPEVTLLYKVYISDLPPPSGRALELFIGDHQVRKYSEFAGGVFFTINDPDLAGRLAGETVRLRFEGTDQIVDTGVSLPSGQHTDDLVKDVAAGRALSSALPSQRELLRK